MDLGYHGSADRGKFPAKPKPQRVPTGFQHVTELIVDGLEGLVVRVMGSRGRVFVPFIIALALFILLANFASILPGGVSPTASLSTTAALAVLVLLVSHGAEIKQKGPKNLHQGLFLTLLHSVSPQCDWRDS